MKMLTVSALVCAMMVLTRAAPPPKETPQSGQKESPLVKTSTDCSSGWSECRGRGYLYVSTPMTWARAEKNCQSLGGNLASVHSIEKYQAIQKVIYTATRSNTRAWIGGCDAQEENQWFWSDGTPFRYHHWCHGEPNNGVVGGQHCIQMNFSAKKCWDDLQCSNKLPSVCVRER